MLSDGIDRAARIVEQLLALACSEPGPQPTRLEPLDLCEVMRQAVADTIALSRGSEFVLHDDAPLSVRRWAACGRR